MKVEEPAIKYNFPMRPEEFLRWERKAEIKHEFIHGEIVPMAGASFIHNTIVGNVIAEVDII